MCIFHNIVTLMSIKLEFNIAKALVLSGVVSTVGIAGAHAHENAGSETQVEDCFFLTDDDADLKNHQLMLKENIENYASKSDVADDLEDYVIDNDIEICYAKLRPVTLGAWKSAENRMLLNTSLKSNEGRRMRVFFHEVVHAIQADTKILERYKDWSIEDRHASSLYNEAASRVVEFIIGYDMKLVGNSKVWNKVKYFGGADTYKDTYEAKIAEGVSKQDAMEIAGSKAWEDVFKDQSWLDAYGWRAADVIITSAQEGDFVRPAVFQRPSDIENKDFSLTGYVSETLNFTRYIPDQIPYEDRFGTNSDLMEVHQFLHGEFLAETLGRQNHVYRKTVKDLESAENPYLGVDIMSVSQDADEKLIDHLKCFAGIRECSEDFGYEFNPTEKRVDPTPRDPRSRVPGKYFSLRVR